MAMHTGPRRAPTLKDPEPPLTLEVLANRMAKKILEVFLPEEVEASIRQYPAETCQRCMIWTGALGNYRYPVIATPNGIRSVPKAVAETKAGKVLPRGRPNIKRLCGTPLCVNPGHYLLPGYEKSQLHYVQRLTPVIPTFEQKVIDDLAVEMIDDQIISWEEAIAHYYYQHDQELITAAWHRVQEVKRR